MKKRIRLLLIEDNGDYSRILRFGLGKRGYAVSAVRTGEAGMRAAASRPADVIILDVMLPDLDGLEVCRQLRRDSNVPILFLSARKSEADRVSGFRLGADDYISKPFSLEELDERIKAVLRRVRPGDDGPGDLRLGGISLDRERRELRVGGKPTEVTPKEFALLELLMKARGKVLSREHLLQRVWGYDEDLGIDGRRVDHHISRLRRRLGPEGARLVAVSGAGYRLRTDGPSKAG